MKTTTLKLAGTNDFFTKEAYKVLRTNLQFCGQDIKVIGITSCEENEGKTTIVLNIAKSFSDFGKKVLVIDGDLRKSVMAGRNTSAKNVSGLSEVLSGLEKLEECIFQTQFPSLHILFSGKYPPNPVELLGSEFFTDLIKWARENYDYVVIDTPPLGPVIDAAVIATNIDGVAMVLSDHRIRASKAKAAINQVNKSGCRMLGVILNKTRTAKGKYYYYYRSKGKYYSYRAYSSYQSKSPYQANISEK